MLAATHRAMRRRSARPFAEGDRLSCLHAGDAMIHPQLHLEAGDWSAFRRELHFDAEHCPGKYLPGRAGNLPPARAKDTRSGKLICLLGRCQARQADEDQGRHSAECGHVHTLFSGGNGTGRILEVGSAYHIGNHVNVSYVTLRL